MSLLFILKWSFYFFVAFFAIGIAMMLLEAALTIILVVTAPFLFGGGLVLSVITAPLTLLLRSLGIKAPYFGKWFFDKIFYVLNGKAARNRQQEQSEYYHHQQRSYEHYQRSEYTQRPPPRDEDGRQETIRGSFWASSVVPAKKTS